MPMRGDEGAFVSQGAESRAGLGRLLFAENAAKLIKTSLVNRLLVERRGPGEQFIEQYAERVNIACRSDGFAPGLFGAGIGRRHQTGILLCGINRLSCRRKEFGNTKIQ